MPRMTNSALEKFAFLHLHSTELCLEKQNSCENYVKSDHRLHVPSPNHIILQCLPVFSSPEPSGSQGELIGWP